MAVWVWFLAALWLCGACVFGMERNEARGRRFVGWSDLSAFQRELPEGSQILTSPEVDAGFAWNELIVSWNTRLSPESNLRVEARAVYPDRATKWYVMGLWSGDRARNPRESVRGQKDADGDVETDTLVLTRPARKAQVRLTLTGQESLVSFLGLSFADTRVKPVALPSSRSAWGTALNVPERSQLAYEGGRGWCSPTSTSMVLAYWARKLSRPEIDRDVPEVAREANDPKWPGTGNWPFNTAFAGSLPGMRAYVTRLSDLAELEQWVSAGVPVVLSVLPRLLTGSDSRSNGHLIVCVGFTPEGDLIANDPWARLENRQRVRRVYRRANAAAAWAYSHHTVYLIYPESYPAPEDRLGRWFTASSLPSEAPADPRSSLSPRS